MCTCSPESQPCPGPHKNKCGEKVEGGDSPHLLCSCETSSGVVHPALGSPAQQRYERARVGPEEGHRNYQRAGILLLGRKIERFGVVHPGEGSRETLWPFNMERGFTKKMERDFLAGPVVTGQGATDLN